MSSTEIINFIYNETIVSNALLSSSVDYNWFTGILWFLFQRVSIKTEPASTCKDLILISDAESFQTNFTPSYLFYDTRRSYIKKIQPLQSWVKRCIVKGRRNFRDSVGVEGTYTWGSSKTEGYMLPERRKGEASSIL